jgi:hypothetical protein
LGDTVVDKEKFDNKNQRSIEKLKKSDKTASQVCFDG